MKRGMKRSSTGWFLMFFSKSLAMRKGRVVIASASITLAVAVITAMAVITTGITRKLGSELKAYGANIIVSPVKTGGIDEGVREKISNIEHVVNVTGQIFTRAIIQDQAIEIIGLDIDTIKGKGWRMYGGWLEKRGEVLAGVNLKEALGLMEGQNLYVRNQSGEKEYVVKGFFEKGGPEDSALIMSLQSAQEMTGEKSKLSALLIRGEPGVLEGIVEEIKQTISGVAVKTYRQVAVAEQSLLGKIKLLMALVSVVVLLASGISVASTMGASVLERREEIGLMKALGATKNQIRLFYITETFLIGIAGSIAGFIIGLSAAQMISKGAFDSYVPLSFYIPVMSLLSGLVLSLLSGHFPVMNALKDNPAVILREE
jgi:putative ABC transport system permease protein